MSWLLAWRQSALRDLRHLSEEDRRRVVAAAECMAETEQGDVRRLEGVRPPEWRLRVGDILSA